MFMVQNINGGMPVADWLLTIWITIYREEKKKKN